MKKQLLTCMALMPALIFAQTTIITDNFDSYTAGSGVVTQSSGLWDTWSGGGGTAEEALVSSAFSSSASNSMNVINGGPSVYLNDMILKFPSTYTTGVYDFNFKIYVPTGKGGYFNLGGNWVTGGTGYQYGGDFFFNADGTGFVDAPGTLVFSYNMAAWNTVSVRVDLGSAKKELFINGVSIGQEAWLASAGFGVVDIFGVAFSDATGGTQVTSDFYVDDVELINMTGVGVEETDLNNQFVLYPNPSNGQFGIKINESATAQYEVLISDISGKVVHAQSINAIDSKVVNFDLDLLPGMYFVNLTNGDNSTVQKIQIK